MDDIVIISWVFLPDIFVELMTIGVFDLGGLNSLDYWSTWNKSESLGSAEISRNIFEFNDGYDAAD